jgi:hypothetical protein
MTTKCILTLANLLILLMINGCDNRHSQKNKTLAPTTSQTMDKQIIATASSLNIGGTYSFGDNVEKGPIGSLMVYPLSDNAALFFLDVCRGAPSYNLGQLFGQMTIKNNIGTYTSKNDGDDFNCILKFKFSSQQIEVITENGHDDCGFGGNVYADHIYTLHDNSIPKYFIDGEGDTTFFEGMTVEKYLHRFD